MHTQLCNNWCPGAIHCIDTIWRQRSGSTLVQVMACCLMAPSHYLNQNSTNSDVHFDCTALPFNFMNKIRIYFYSLTGFRFCYEQMISLSAMLPKLLLAWGLAVAGWLSFVFTHRHLGLDTDSPHIAPCLRKLRNAICIALIKWHVKLSCF